MSLTLVRGKYVIAGVDGAGCAIIIEDGAVLVHGRIDRRDRQLCGLALAWVRTTRSTN
jgi:hypothetical protein